MSEKKIPNLPSNSNTKAKTEKKVQKVVSSPVVHKKKGLGSRFKTYFLSEDAGSVTSYLLYDILIPAAKEMLYEAITGGAKFSLFGEGGSSRHTKRDKQRSYASYSKYYISDAAYGKEPTPSRRSTPPRSASVRHEFGDIIFSSRSDAERVLDSLVDLVIDYGVASVADLFDMADLERSYTDNKYGWTDLEGAKVEPVREGWVLVLPKPKVIE